jgi:stearoyl-CoA desaturase (delta-9 desaturase)
LSIVPTNRSTPPDKPDAHWWADDATDSEITTLSVDPVDDLARQDKPPISEPADFWNRSIMLTAIIVPFLGFLAGIAYCWTIGWMGWPFLALLIAGWCISGTGVSIGFHRLLTHSAFATYRPLRVLWMIMGAASIEGSPLVWCAVHRKHHQFSDHLGDPHSPNLHGKGIWNGIRGFIYGHCGWLLTTHWSKPELPRYVPDLLQDKVLIMGDRFYYLWVLLSLGIPTGIGVAIAAVSGDYTLGMGALLGFLWGGLVRVFIGHHITWSVNSICHLFGKHPYNTGDLSTNNFICATVSFGEGWHNNHHAFPSSARHGLHWWQLDTSWLAICAMKKLGLAWDIKVPSSEIIATKEIH